MGDCGMVGKEAGLGGGGEEGRQTKGWRGGEGVLEDTRDICPGRCCKPLRAIDCLLSSITVSGIKTECKL